MKLNWEDFKGQFDESWHEWVKPIIESEQFYRDFQELKKHAKEGVVIPSGKSGNLFRIFREVKYTNLTCVVVGLSPYNVIINGLEVADGIAMSCSKTGKEQPTLTQWYNAMEKEFGEIVREPDLSYLCKQGVFLYNVSLTTGKGNATNHLYIWEHFTKELFSNAIKKADVPIITLGKEAEKVLSYCQPWHMSFELKHPAWASYAKTNWDSEGAFKQVQDFLHERGIPFTWVKTKNKF